MRLATLNLSGCRMNAQTTSRSRGSQAQSLAASGSTTALAGYISDISGDKLAATLVALSLAHGRLQHLQLAGLPTDALPWLAGAQSLLSLDLAGRQSPWGSCACTIHADRAATLYTAITACHFSFSSIPWDVAV